MELSKLEDDSFALNASVHELGVIGNSIEVVLREIEEWEFQTRMGLYPHEARQVLAMVRNSIDRVDREQDRIQIQFAEAGMLAINNGLNEVAHGLMVRDFESKLGKSRPEFLQFALQFFKQVHALLDGTEEDSANANPLC